MNERGRGCRQERIGRNGGNRPIYPNRLERADWFEAESTRSWIVPVRAWSFKMVEIERLDRPEPDGFGRLDFRTVKVCGKDDALEKGLRFFWWRRHLKNISSLNALAYYNSTMVTCYNTNMIKVVTFICTKLNLPVFSKPNQNSTIGISFLIEENSKLQKQQQQTN